jgi:isocitrate/isopropylmalate dehydrogenase
MFTLAISKKYNMLMILKGRNVLKVDDPMWEKVITKATMMFAL